jgi:hypothetical protein
MSRRGRQYEHDSIDPGSAGPFGRLHVDPDQWADALGQWLAAIMATPLAGEPGPPYVHIYDPAPVLTLGEMADLLDHFKPRPASHAVMHPIALRALREACPPAEPPPPGLPGLDIAALHGLPLVEDPDMEPGAWEIRNGDEVIASGTVRVEIERPFTIEHNGEWL